jgi:hypothetical protein
MGLEGLRKLVRPMQWACERDGCYRDAMPRLDLLAECLPGVRTGFSDLDGAASLNGRVLVLEWKAWTEPGDLKVGQRRLLEDMTRLSGHLCAVVALGDPKTMDAHHFRVVHQGKLGPWTACTPDEFRDRLQRIASRMAVLPPIRTA